MKSSKYDQLCGLVDRLLGKSGSKAIVSVGSDNFDRLKALLRIDSGLVESHYPLNRVSVGRCTQIIKL